MSFAANLSFDTLQGTPVCWNDKDLAMFPLIYILFLNGIPQYQSFIFIIFRFVQVLQRSIAWLYSSKVRYILLMQALKIQLEKTIEERNALRNAKDNELSSLNPEEMDQVREHFVSDNESLKQRLQVCRTFWNVHGDSFQLKPIQRTRRKFTQKCSETILFSESTEKRPTHATGPRVATVTLLVTITMWNFLAPNSKMFSWHCWMQSRLIKMRYDSMVISVVYSKFVSN